jgi:phosphatidylinositol-3-phosphatase
VTRAVATLLLVSLLCGGAHASASRPLVRHIVVIVFENRDPEDVTPRTAPAFSALASKYVRLANYHAVAHPSLPNYVAMISGSTHGITSDCTTCTVRGRTIGDQLERAGRTWGVYAEGYSSSPRYAKKHVPFLYFETGTAHVYPLSRFDPQAPPDFAFVVPDLCHDMHDCSVRVGDGWLKRFVGPLLRVPATAVFVVFDESEGGHSAAARVPAIVVGSAVRGGVAATRRHDHYALLRTIEDALGLPHLGAAAQAPSMAEIWR